MWYIMPPCLPWRYLLVLPSLVACLYNYQHSAVYRDSQVELVLNYQAVLLNWFWGLVAHFVSYKIIVISDKNNKKDNHSDADCSRSKYDVPRDLEGTVNKVPEVSKSQQCVYADSVNCIAFYFWYSHWFLPSHKGQILLTFSFCFTFLIPSLTSGLGISMLARCVCWP